MYIGCFIQEVHWINASKRNQFCSKLYKKYILFSFRDVEKETVKY